MTKIWFPIVGALCGLWLVAHAQDTDGVAEDRPLQRAALAYQNGAYAEAISLYQDALGLASTDEQKRWIQFRIEDSRMRAFRGARSLDTDAFEAALDALRAVADPEVPESERDLVWAHANESLGDHHWTLGYPNNDLQALNRYGFATDWWAGRPASDEARERYLRIVEKLFQRGASQFAWEEARFDKARQLLDNAEALSVDGDFKGRIQWRRAQLFASSSSPERRLDAVGAFESAVDTLEEPESRARALYEFAQFLSQRGVPVIDAGNQLDNRRDYVKAAALLREILDTYEVGAVSVRRPAENQLASIVDPSLNLFTNFQYYPDQEPKFGLVWRNVSEVSFRLQRLGFDSIDPRRAERWRSGDLVTLFEDVAGLQTLQRWSFNTEDQGSHEPGRREGMTPPEPLNRGWYLLTATGEGQTAQTLIQVGDLTALLAPTENGVTAHVAESMSGAPVEDARAVLWVGQYQNRRWVWESQRAETDSDGYARFDTDGGRRRFVVVSDGDSIAITGDVGQSPNQRPAQWKGTSVSDRPVYRPGESISWKWTGRRSRGGAFETPAGQRVRFEIVGPRGDTVSEGTADLNDYGSLFGEVLSDESWALGSYRLSVGLDQPQTGFLHSETLFRLESFEPPEFRVTVTPPMQGDKALVFRPGAEVAVEVAAAYYAGGAVAGAEVELLVSRQPLWFRWGPEPRPYWLMRDAMIAPRPPMQGSTEPWKRLTSTTDTAGKAQFSFEALNEDPDQDWQFFIEARVTDVSRKMVSGSGVVKTTRRPYVVKPSTERVLFEPGQPVSLRLEAKDANDSPVAAKGQVEVVEMSTKTVWTNPEGEVLSPEAEARERRRHPVFPPPTDGLPWRREDQTVERVVARQAISMSAQGEAIWEYTPNELGTLRFRWIPSEFLVDAAERDSTDIWVVREALDGSGYHQGALQWIADTEEVEVGDTLTALLTAPVSGRWAQVFIETGSEVERRSIRIEGTARAVRIPITSRHTPNFFLHAFSVGDLRVDRATLEVTAAPSDHFLDVSVRSVPEDPQPGDEAELVVDVVDREGSPVEAELTLRVFDQALTAIADSQAQDPRAVFYGQARYSWFRPISSVGLFAFEPRFLRDGQSSFGGGFGGGGFGGGGAGFPQSEMADSGIALGRSAAAPMAMRAMADAKVETASALGDSGAPVAIRTNFALTALWSAELVTDKNGRATASFVFPDSLTEWRAEARAISTETDVGMETTTTATSKPLMARLQIPRFLTLGDRSTVSVTLQNESGAAIEAAPELQVDGKRLPDATAQVVPPGASRRFDWDIEATGLAPVVVTAQVEAGSFQDAVRREIPVVDYGSPVWMTRAGKTQEEETTLRFELPQRRREGSAELVLQLAPSLSGALLDATPYLVRYPYGCVEQTLSRFLPAAMVAKVLTQQGMTAEDATGVVNQRIEEGMLGFLPRETSEPLSSLDEVTRDGLARLLEMQTPEGGWGWWPGGRGNLYMTAYVTWGLSLGSEIGLDVDPGVLRRARAFLANGLIEIRYDPDLLAWTLHALVGGELAEPQTELVNNAIEWLWERHPRLTSYGRALFAMALHGQGMEERARLLVANLSNGVLYDDGGSRLDDSSPKGAAPTASWGAQNDWRRWSRSPVESTAFALMALMEIDPDSKWVEPAATWLLNNRTGSRWGHTKETAIALLALSDYAALAPVAAASWEYEVLWNGRSISTVTVDPNNPIRGEIRVQLEDADIGSGVQDLVLRRSAEGAPLYYAAQLRYFDQSTAILPQSSEIAIQRSYARQRAVETLLDGLKTEWEPIDEGTPLAVGDIVECVLTVEAKNDLEYLLFESPKAAGMEPLERQSGYRSMRRVPLGEVDQFTRRTLGSSGAYCEFRRGHIAVFADRLDQGIWEFRYRLRATVPGRFAALPAVGEAMYVPRIRANSANRWTEIVAATDSF